MTNEHAGVILVSLFACLFLFRKYILQIIDLVYKLCFISMCAGLVYVIFATPLERKQVLKFLIDHL